MIFSAAAIAIALASQPAAIEVRARPRYHYRLKKRLAPKREIAPPIRAGAEPKAPAELTFKQRWWGGE